MHGPEQQLGVRSNLDAVLSDSVKVPGCSHVRPDPNTRLSDPADPADPAGYQTRLKCHDLNNEVNARLSTRGICCGVFNSRI